MKFEFEGEQLEGKKIGYVGDRHQFSDFIKRNSHEIEDIITDKLEERDIFQWDTLNINLKISSNEDCHKKHIVMIGDVFEREETFEGDLLIRTITGTIFCIAESDLVIH